MSLLLVDQPSTKELQSTLIPEFERSSGIDVSVEIVPESGLDAKLATAMSGNQAQYDVVMTGAKNLGTLVSSGWLQPLDDLVAKSDEAYTAGFPETLIQNLKISDKSYAMPYQVGADMLFYNKDHLTKAGLDAANPPKTLDEVVAAAAKLKQASKVTPFVARGSREGNENSFSWLMLWFLEGGRWPENAKGTVQQDAAVLTEAPAIKATEAYFKLLGEFGPDGAANYTFAEAQKAMQDGRASMWIDAAQLGPALEGDGSKVAGKVGYQALTGKGGDDYNVGAVWGFSIAKATQDPTDSFELIEFLTSKETGVAQVVSGTNGSTGRTDVLEDADVKKALNPEFVAALTEAIAHTNPAYTPNIPEGPQIRGALALSLSQGLTSTRDAAKTMKAASDQVKGISK
ncbi:sugar ABC transporter substrate-binding protein [Knoellia sp. S7-12]|uniref:ABC transporter substrate-binding protein n=1 Tax=Knoellia sp. S7-12 TaxID=3126698 RepID=UPI003366E74F